MDLTVQWARVLVSWYCCYDIVHMVDVNIFEYFNMPESCWGSAIQQWQSDMKLHHLLSLHFHKALFTTLLLSNIWLLHAGFYPLKPSSQRLNVSFFCVCFPFSLSVCWIRTPTRSFLSFYSFDKKDMHCDFKTA